MKTLTTKEVVRLLREEYTRQLNEFDTQPYKGQDEGEDVLSQGLKVRHGKSRLLYTVQSIGLSDVILLTPDGKDFVVTKDQLEKEYEID